MTARLPWETIETFPGTTPARLAGCRSALADATSDDHRVRALVDLALATYWAAQVGADDRTWAELAIERRSLVDEAVTTADRDGRPEIVATARLGRLYACWGPDHLLARADDLDVLADLVDDLDDEELRLRTREWSVLDRLDHGDLAAARVGIEQFTQEARGTGLLVFARREQLWRANLAMLEGRIDEAVTINQEVVADTADTAGTPFSFQNVAITVAIERYLRRGLADVIETVRSIRASSPRVGTAWDTGLAFSLAETGRTDEAADLLGPLVADDLAAIPRDLNWLVVVHLLGLTAVRLGDLGACRMLHDQLEPFADLDATHGSGYASYGPVGRVVGQLAATIGRPADAVAHLDRVLASRPPGPWTSLTRHDRALTTSGTDPDGAADEARRAAAELARFGMGAWAEESRDVAERAQAAGRTRPLARFRDGSWELSHPTGTATVATSRGMDHLVELLARPGEPIPVTVLDTHVDPGVPAASAHDTTVDPRAVRAYRARLADLESRPRPTRDELDEVAFLRRELAGGTYVVSAPEIERARVRVTKALRRAVDAVRRAAPGLGDHLAASLQTGRTCLYAPADGRAWTVTGRVGPRPVAPTPPVRPAGRGGVDGAGP